MKRTESSGLPTVLDEKKSSGLIELSLRTTDSNLLVSTAHISMVGEPEKSGCYVLYKL